MMMHDDIVISYPEGLLCAYFFPSLFGKKFAALLYLLHPLPDALLNLSSIAFSMIS